MNTPQSPVDAYLTLIAPLAVEEALVDFLLRQGERIVHFTTLPCDDFGGPLGEAEIGEQVRGRIARLRVQLLLSSRDIPGLLSALGERLPRRGIAYWVTPVSQFGSIQ